MCMPLDDSYVLGFGGTQAVLEQRFKIFSLLSDEENRGLSQEIQALTISHTVVP